MAAFQKSFYAFAVANCATCHGVDVSPLFALSDVPTAYANAKPFVDFSSPASSLFVTYAGNGHCGVPSCMGNSSGALAALAVWAEAELASATSPVRTPVSDFGALDVIASDLQTQAPADRGYLRYFTLEAWGNLMGQPPTVSIDVERAALVKMVNLLSTGPRIVQPVAVDGQGYVYRVDMRQLGWTAAAWTNIKATDPYFTPSSFSAALSQAASQTVRADWFVANIPNSPVNAYFVFLGINSDDPTIDAMNGVNRFADMDAGAPRTFRVGLAVSNTEAHNRILSWHQTTALGSGPEGTGHLFKSYNFDTDVGTQDIFSHPYMPTTNNPNPPGPYDFDYADSDNIFTLPNGLFGYYTVEGASQGQVMNAQNAGAPFPGPTFCFQCHDDRTNMVPLTDQMNAALQAAPPGAFPSSLLTLLMGIYDANAISQKMAQAGTRFAQAYAALNLPVTETPGVGTESLNIVTNNYSVVLGVAMAAAELGVAPAKLVSAIKSSTALSLELGSLITQDASGNLNGTVRRDTWEGAYGAVRTVLFPPEPGTDGGVPITMVSFENGPAN